MVSLPSLERFKVLVDESGTPSFRASLAAEEGYVVSATILPIADELLARCLLPRRADGSLIKASDREASDEMAANFLQQLFDRTRACAAIVTVATRDENNQALAERIKRARKRRPVSVPELVRFLAAKDAFGNALTLPDSENAVPFADLVFDRGVESASMKQLIRDEVVRPLARSHARGIGDVRWESKEAEPLIMLSDWIAGAVRVDTVRGSLPKTRQVLAAAASARRLHDQTGFKVNLPSAASETS